MAQLFDTRVWSDGNTSAQVDYQAMMINIGGGWTSGEVFSAVQAVIFEPVALEEWMEKQRILADFEEAWRESLAGKSLSEEEFWKALEDDDDC